MKVQKNGKKAKVGETKTRQLKEIRKASIRYTPRVIVKFKNDQCLGEQGIPYDDRIKKRPRQFLGQNWSDLIQQFPGTKIQPLITSVSPEGIEQLERKAGGQDASCRRLPSLRTYFAVRPPSRKSVKAVAETLRSWKTVDGCYVEPLPKMPRTTPGTTGYPPQWHLDPSQGVAPYPGGIDARYAWSIPGGNGEVPGAGLRFADLEYGWVLDHEGLPSGNRQIRKPIYGANNAYYRGHGTGALGVVLATGMGNIPRFGITPRIAIANVVSPGQWSRMRQDWTDYKGVAAAIIKLLDLEDPVLQFGDVLLLEVQTGTGDREQVPGDLPIEVMEVEFAAIKQATALGIVVIEPAGNGGFNLDNPNGTPEDPVTFNWTTGPFSLDRAGPSPHFQNSGAIMVGAFDSWTRTRLNNFGSRIDCYGPANNVETTGFDDGPDGVTPKTNGTTQRDSYFGFSGTSAAAAVIAGAALALQGIAQANRIKGAEADVENRFSPKELRDILSNPNTGTRINDDAGKLIGVMPDLRQIIEDLRRQGYQIPLPQP